MTSLPTDVERAWIWRFDPSDEPVFWAGISVPPDVEDLPYLVTRVVQKRLERIPGVGRVDVWGVDEAVVWADLDREALTSHGAELVELMERLGSDNFQLASGQLTDRRQVRYARLGVVRRARGHPLVAGEAGALPDGPTGCRQGAPTAMASARMLG